MHLNVDMMRGAAAADGVEHEKQQQPPRGFNASEPGAAEKPHRLPPHLPRPQPCGRPHWLAGSYEALGEETARDEATRHQSTNSGAGIGRAQ